MVSGMTLFGRDDIADNNYWRCEPCDAHVGCHPHTTVPLGKLADYDLRRAREDLHRVFDPIWKRRARNAPHRFEVAVRNELYQELATRMGLTWQQCHIALFDHALIYKAFRSLAGLK